MIEERIRELERKITSYCVSSQCRYNKWLIGRFQCLVGRGHCRKSQVRRWLNEIKKLEGGKSEH